GAISWHDHRQRAAQGCRRPLAGGDRRRRPGDAGQRGGQGLGPQGAQALPRQGGRRFRRRHRRCLHPVRALRVQAGEAPGPPGALGHRVDQGLAHRPRASPAGSDAGGRRSRGFAHHHRQRRRARTRARRHRHRLGRLVCTGRGQGAAGEHRARRPRHRQEVAGDRGGAVYLYEPAPHPG
ncbi:MAG: ATP-dependent protease subunit HslV, partial [uncultured Ramlibacter sp.]